MLPFCLLRFWFCWQTKLRVVTALLGDGMCYQCRLHTIFVDVVIIIVVTTAAAAAALIFFFIFHDSLKSVVHVLVGIGRVRRRPWCWWM